LSLIGGAGEEPMKLNGHISQPDKRTSGARASGSERYAYRKAKPELPSGQRSA